MLRFCLLHLSRTSTLYNVKYFIIAGEASGDLHGSTLIQALRLTSPGAHIDAWGGDLMQAAGAVVHKHYRDLAFMGFVEVIKNLPTIFRNFSLCKKHLSTALPDVVILIDYPGFNLPIAKWLYKNKIKVVYYIAPQVWAWKSHRVHQLKKYCNKILVVLPFEEAFYKKYGVDVTYVGHPLLEYVRAQNLLHCPSSKSQKTIALLPGSRKQEIDKILPVLLAVASHHPEHRFVVAQAPNTQDAWLSAAVQLSNCSIIKDATYATIAAADLAVVASGTATLETALIGTPQIVVYKAHPISVWLARKWVGSRIKYISLVNLILDRSVVPELIQEDCTVPIISQKINELLHDATSQTTAYKELYALLGNGSTVQRAAAIITTLAS